MELTAEQIHEHLDKFTPIYDNGEEVNPIPNDFRVTVWCDNGLDDAGFVCDTVADEMGLEQFIAKRWIKEADLHALFTTHTE
jgi:hypothetical protein